MSKINKTKLNDSDFIGKSKEKVSAELDKKIKFSFKYLDLNKKFNINDCGTNYLLLFISRLSVISDMYAKKFKECELDTLSNHRIDWDKPKYTENCFGIPEEEKKAYSPFQFGLDNNKYGRIHGFIIDNIFYVVWIDPKHRLYELDYINYGVFFDEHHLDLIKSNIRKNGCGWAADHIQSIEDQYKNRFQRQKKDNEELFKEVYQKEEIINKIKEKVCRDCTEIIDNIL